MATGCDTTTDQDSRTRDCRNWSVSMRGSSRKSPISRPIKSRRLPPSEPDQETLANGDIVRHLAQSAVYGVEGLAECPSDLRRVLEQEAWRHFADPFSKRVFDYGPEEFDKVTRAAAPAGLGIPVGIAGLIRICENIAGDDSTVALRLIRGLLPEEKPHGASPGNQNAAKAKQENEVDVINSVSKGGTSETYLIRRLKRDNQELHAKVVAGEM